MRIFALFSNFRSIRFWRTLHLWLSVLLSLQLLAWFGSGLVMSILPIDEVRGDHLRAKVPAIDWQQAQVSPAQLPAVSGAITIKQRGEMPVYQLDNGQQQRFFSAKDGTLLLPLTAGQLQGLAQQSYSGSAQVQSAQLLQHLPQEARGLTSPVWQVQFADADQTVFYLHPVTGELLRVRTNNWRLFDFVWMLHIMDYNNRTDFNHALLIISSALALLFTLSGLILLVLTLTRRRASRLRPTDMAGSAGI